MADVQTVNASDYLRNELRLGDCYRSGTTEAGSWRGPHAMTAHPVRAATTLGSSICPAM